MGTLSRGGCTSLMVAAMFGHAEAVTLLATAGADVNARARKGATALHYAAGTVEKYWLWFVLIAKHT